jgi:hypothetical protein
MGILIYYKINVYRPHAISCKIQLVNNNNNNTIITSFIYVLDNSQTGPITNKTGLKCAI